MNKVLNFFAMGGVLTKEKKEKVYKQVGSSNKEKDSKIPALKPGWRKSKYGNVYFENRANRSDVSVASNKKSSNKKASKKK
jgi:hypothetical protein